MNQCDACPSPNNINFGGTLCCLLTHILTTNPMCSPIFLPNMDLIDAYMCAWFRTDDITLLTFIVIHLPYYTKTLINFHLCLPMGYV